jgi:hypothetical protein
MTVWLLPILILISGFFLISIFTRFKFPLVLINLGIVVGSSLLILITMAISIYSQTSDKEVWSGYVVDWDHNEEWEEWVPPQTTCTTDSKGNQSCTTTPGYWIHHYAENYIKTTDDGWVSVSRFPDGKKMDDSYPNDVKPLKEVWKKGSPTASTHRYENKVQASYSVFKNEGIDLEDFKGLPEYPIKVRDYFHVDRMVGDFPNKKEANKKLEQWNSDLNVMIDDPDNKGKKRSYKQVNIIFVNVGSGKSEEYGMALQDSWENGNKNDFVISMSMEKDGTVNWVYPFSWSESENLKLEVKDYIVNQKKIEDFSPIVDETSKMIEEQYVRKEFEDFSYLHVDVGIVAQIIIWLITLAALILFGLFTYKHYEEEKRMANYRNRYSNRHRRIMR